MSIHPALLPVGLAGTFIAMAVGCSKPTGTTPPAAAGGQAQTEAPSESASQQQPTQADDNAGKSAQTATAAGYIGFRGEQDLFEAYPGDDVTLEQDGDRKAMRWDTAMNGQHRACIKELEAGALSGTTKMKLAVRSDIAGDVWIQVNEPSGEGFYQTVPVKKGWTDVTLILADLRLNDDKVENRKLDVEKITKVIVIDLVGLDGGPGKRAIWFADWEFVSEPSAEGGAGLQPAPSTERLAQSKPVSRKNLAEMPTLTSAQLQSKVDSVLPTEDESRWLRIPWRTNLMQARLDAQQTGKPMLIWIMDGNVLGCT